MLTPPSDAYPSEIPSFKFILNVGKKARDRGLKVYGETVKSIFGTLCLEFKFGYKEMDRKGSLSK